MRRACSRNLNLSASLDRATLAHEVALEAGNPNLIVTTADELRRLEERIEGDER